ncbi:L-threonylcarbamoyladenylate synthase [Lampropedia aestuarii]|uniref:L-threonylcarbamoyladenylate synthase n=1 Tax=Lampropedia aestuarii TaxID=2562762 RepID=UPI002469ACCA|nr:L-threonylcarbamoyladenylate synthase [Lampropedia aestuarii]MDH5858608.1 L-threonylcarbamoyladenylate synthase [Lampropedia aestuarii]
MIASPTPDAIAAAVAALQQAQLIGLPTETVYGLAADALQAEAVAKIFERKGRPADHPLIVHVADEAGAAHFAADIPAFAAALMEAFWPGPLTLIVPRRPGVADTAAAGQDTIGLRCPSHPVAQQILRACHDANPPVWGVAAPSANRFGRVSPTTAAHVAQEFGDGLLVIDGGPCDVGIESTIVDCSRGQPVLLRPGHIGAAQIAQVTGMQVLDPHTAVALLDQQEPKAPGTLTAHYAPSATVRLMAASDIAAALGVLGEQAKHIAVYARTPMENASGGVLLRRMPQFPEAVAHELFSVLRECDAQGVKLIWIEAVPSDAAWDGVRDRLQRAAASA